jgi:hypothetical protein
VTPALEGNVDETQPESNGCVPRWLLAVSDTQFDNIHLIILSTLKLLPTLIGWLLIPHPYNIWIFSVKKKRCTTKRLIQSTLASTTASQDIEDTCIMFRFELGWHYGVRFVSL